MHRAMSNESYLEEKAEADPLIIFDVFFIGFIFGGSGHTGMRHVDAWLLEMGTV